jgi:hypothetical protein
MSFGDRPTTGYWSAQVRQPKAFSIAELFPRKPVHVSHYTSVMYSTLTISCCIISSHLERKRWTRRLRDIIDVYDVITCSSLSLEYDRRLRDSPLKKASTNVLQTH